MTYFTECIITSTAVTTCYSIFGTFLDGVHHQDYSLIKEENFVNKLNDEVCKEFSIQRSVTSGYHPQTNSLDERKTKL